MRSRRAPVEPSPPGALPPQGGGVTAAAALGRKQRIKNGVYASLGALSYASAAPLWRRLDTHDLRVVMYHKVNDLAGNSLTVPPDVFRRQMHILRSENNVIAPELLSSV